jgi:hypothetical protein
VIIRLFDDAQVNGGDQRIAPFRKDSFVHDAGPSRRDRLQTNC